MLKRSAIIVAVASTARSAPARAAEEGFDPTAATVKMMAALALIIGLLLIAMWLLKKFRPTQLALGGANRAVEVLARTMLTPKAGLSVVKVGGKVLVLGVTDQQVNLVAELTDPEAIESLTAPAGGGKTSFADLVGRIGRRGGAEK